MIVNWCLSLFILMFATAAHADVKDGLIGHWTFDEGSGTTAADSCAKDNSLCAPNNATLTNGSTKTIGPTWTTGPLDGAVHLDGVDDYVKLTTGLGQLSSFTITAFIKMDVSASTEENGNNAFWAGDWGNYIMLRPSGYIIGLPEPSDAFIQNATVSNVDIWSHIAIVKTPSRISYYRNGRLVETKVLNNAAPTNFSNFVLGSYNYSVYRFNGTIDDVRLYNRALTDGSVNVNDNDIATLAGAIDGDAPTAPTGLTASGNSETQINLTWVSSSDNLMVAGYKIYRDSGNGFVEIGRSSSNSYADSQGLILGVTYRYQLKAYDRAGNESGLSNTASAKPVKSVCVGQTNRVCTPESGNVEHVQAAINQAQDGDTVKLPAGSYTWTDGVTIIGKGIKIEGEGSGRVIARSTSSVSVGIGLKTFSTQIGLPLTIGQALEIERTGSVHSAGVPTGSRARMLGTVASYSGSSLTVNVTNIEGSGTHPLWIMSTSAQTTIINNSAPCSTPDQTQNCAMVKITEDDTHHVELSGIRFVRGTAIGNMFAVYPKAAGKPILVHDNYIEENNSLGNTAFFISTASGIFWRNSFVARLYSQSVQPFQVYTSAHAWTSPSTMGDKDITGTNNFYIEDSDFHAFSNVVDFNDNARGVLRHNVFNNSGIGSHGADTSTYGNRHFEIYDNEFIFNGYNNGQTMNVPYRLYLRGGTGVFADNKLDPLSSQDYSNRPTINMTVMNLQRNAGPNPCWKGGYPAPRQVGMGRVTGVAGNDAFSYKGDSEPIYIWGNSGTVSVGISDYAPTQCGSNPPSSSSFIQAGRDYFNNGTAKPGYVKFQYPHPLTVPGITANGSGDVSNDGKVTMYDAALVLRFTLGSSLTDAQKQKANMNGDKNLDGSDKIDGADVVAIARKAVGL